MGFFNACECSIPGGIAKVTFGSDFQAIRWEESGIVGNQDAMVAQMDFGRLPRRALIESSGVRMGWIAPVG